MDKENNKEFFEGMTFGKTIIKSLKQALAHERKNKKIVYEGEKQCSSCSYTLSHDCWNGGYVCERCGNIIKND